MKSCKKMTRHDFLRHSFHVAAGLTFLPHSALASLTKESNQVSTGKLAEYQMIVPDQASPIEQQAAKKLQHYLAEISRKDLVLRKEEEYRGGPSFFIDKPNTLKRGRLISTN
jgi:hypothetical protein